MKQIIITLSLVVSTALVTMAQTRPQITNYMFNYPALNPAATGIEDYSQVRLGMRRQWTGVDGAPATNWISGNMHLQTAVEKKDNESFAGVITKGHGIGFNIWQDKTGPYSAMSINLGYAYHMPLSDDLALSAGFAGGIQHLNYDASKSIYPDQPYDPAAGEASNTQKKYSPDLNAGIMLNGKNFFGGLSVLQVIPSKFLKTETDGSRYRAQFIGSAGYVFRFADNKNSLWFNSAVKTDFANPVRFDLMAKYMYADLVWAGASYRNQDAIGINIGVTVSKRFTVGYLYETGINNSLSTYSKGSHEFCAGFKILKQGQEHTTRMGW